MNIASFVTVTKHWPRTAWASAYQYIATQREASNTTSTSSNFEVLFNAALAKYTNQTGNDLRNHPLAIMIDSCDSPDSILDIFQEQARAFE
ncbi:hypothetical protein V8E52_008714 [Russula decolorans]